MIEASDKIIGHVFSNDFFFQIPEYQRLYRWGEEQCENLLDDVIGHLQAHEGTDIPNIPEYFLGNIVLVQNPNGNNRFDVIDGQQRLTTITILFSALHDAEDNQYLQNSLADRITTAGDAAMGIDPQPRLTVREAMRMIFGFVQDLDNEQRAQFFNPAIQTQQLLGREPTEVEETVRRNALLLRSRIGELDQENRHRLILFLNQRCVLVVAKTDNVDAAMLIFQVMNDRGLDLSPTDVLKPEIIGAAGNGQAELARSWEDIEESLGSDDFLNLFSHIRFIYGRNEIRGSLTQRFRDQVLDNLPEENLGHVFIEDVLKPYARAYQRVSDPNSARDHVAGTGGIDNAPNIQQTLQNLNELDFDSWKPVVMYAFRRREEIPDQFNWGDFAQFLRKLEAAAFSLALRRASKSERANRFGNIIDALENWNGGELPVALELADNEKNETLEALNGPIYKRPTIAKPVLLLLDRALADAGAEYDHRTISLEHVLPQTLPQDGWNAGEENGEAFIWSPDNEEHLQLHSEWQHRIANLVLLARRRNIQAGNRSYPDKKETYFFANGQATPFVVTNELLAINAWTPEVLTDRQERLVRTIAARWGILQN